MIPVKKSSKENKVFQHGPSLVKLEDMLQMLIFLKGMSWHYLLQAITLYAEASSCTYTLAKGESGGLRSIQKIRKLPI